VATPVKDFIQSMFAEFGDCAFRAISPAGHMVEKNWPTDKKHPSNAPDKKFVKPCMDYLIGKKNGKTSPQHL